jgi:acyl-CoA synthetase (NDP forming)
MDDKTEASLIESHREQLVDFKKQLAAILEELLVIGLDDKDELFAQHDELEKLQFGCSHKVRQLLNSLKTGSIATSALEERGVKLPKLDTFI